MRLNYGENASVLVSVLLTEFYDINCSADSNSDPPTDLRFNVPLTQNKPVWEHSSQPISGLVRINKINNQEKQPEKK